MKYQYGDVYYVNPAEDKPYYTSRMALKYGRPGIIISSQSAMGRYQVMVVLCTTKARYNDPCAFSTVIKGRTATVLCNEIQTVDISQLGEYITHLGDPDVFRLTKSLKNSLGFIIEQNDAEQKIEEIRKILGPSNLEGTFTRYVPKRHRADDEVDDEEEEGSKDGKY